MNENYVKIKYKLAISHIIHFYEVGYDIKNTLWDLATFILLVSGCWRSVLSSFKSWYLKQTGLSWHSKNAAMPEPRPAATDTPNFGRSVNPI